MRPKVILFSIFLSLLVLLLFFLILKPQTSKPGSKTETKIKITASFYPLAFFAQSIGGDKVEVVNLTPTGVEPHAFEPTPKDMAQIYSSRLFIYNGVNLEGWVDKVLPELDPKQIVVVRASDNLSVINSDPHIWLDPVLAQQIVLNLKNALINIDPTNSTYYQQNSDQLIVKLITLDTQYQKSLSFCQQDTVISSHGVLGYLASRYHFQNVSITGLSPDAEPSAQKMADVSKLIQTKKIAYLFIEPLDSPKYINTLAAETSAKILGFNPLEGLTPDQLAKKEDYFSIQNQNITNLAIALSCPTH